MVSNPREVRLVNLNKLIEDSKMTVARWAEENGLKLGSVYQWKSGHTPIGDLGARQIERALNLPIGWLDTDWNMLKEKQGHEVAIDYDNLCQENRELVSSLIAKLLQNQRKNSGRDVDNE